jgi:hypothetical protein
VPRERNESSSQEYKPSTISRQSSKSLRPHAASLQRTTYYIFRRNDPAIPCVTMIMIMESDRHTASALPPKQFSAYDSLASFALARRAQRFARAPRHNGGPSSLHCLQIMMRELPPNHPPPLSFKSRHVSITTIIKTHRSHRRAAVGSFISLYLNSENN